MKKYRICDLYDNYDVIPTTSGIYFIECPKNFAIESLNSTTGREIYKNKPVKIYETDKLNQKYLSGDKTILYIGKADCLQERIKEYIKWAYNEPYKPHSGGKAIWQIKNNKDLLIWWQEDDDPVLAEKIAIKQYKEQYEVYPLANWRC